MNCFITHFNRLPILQSFGFLAIITELDYSLAIHSVAISYNWTVQQTPSLSVFKTNNQHHTNQRGLAAIGQEKRSMLT